MEHEMIKKLIFTAGAVTVLGYLLLGASITDYAAALWNRAQGGAENLVPLDLQLDRAQRALDRVEEDLTGHKRRAAEISVTIEDLEQEVRKLAVEEKATMAALRRLREAYAATGNGARQVALYQGRKVRADEVRAMAERTLLRAESIRRRRALKEALLRSRRGHLAKIENAVRRAELDREKLQTLLETRRVELECARLAGVDFSTLQPSCALAEARKALGKVDRKIRVLKKLDGIDPERTGLAWLEDATQGESLAERINALLQQKQQSEEQKTEAIKITKSGP